MEHGSSRPSVEALSFGVAFIGKVGEFLQAKKIKLPSPQKKSITPKPTTDAEMITDLLLTQWRSSHEKKKVERLKAEVRITQTTGVDIIAKSRPQRETIGVESRKDTSQCRTYEEATLQKAVTTVPTGRETSYTMKRF